MPKSIHSFATLPVTPNAVILIQYSFTGHREGDQYVPVLFRPYPVLSDPLINAVMRADRVSRKELELLMTTVATKNFSDETVCEWRRPVAAFVSAQPLKSGTDLLSKVCQGAAC